MSLIKFGPLGSVVRWEPLNELDRLFDERLLSSFPSFQKLGGDLAVDLYEEGGNVIAKMTLPEIDPKDLDVSVEEETLRVSGKREEEKEEKNKEYYSKEIRRGAFSRAIGLPKTVDPSSVKAEYKDGVLVVTMPTLKEQKKEPIKIEVKK